MMILFEYSSKRANMKLRVALSIAATSSAIVIAAVIVALAHLNNNNNNGNSSLWRFDQKSNKLMMCDNISSGCAIFDTSKARHP